MPTYCCVPLCKIRGGHQFPKEQKRKAEWLQAIRRSKWTPKDRSIVCKSHFKDEDYVSDTPTFHGSERTRKDLKKSAVPSVFKWTKAPSTSSIQRQKRAQRKVEEVRDECKSMNDTIGELDVHEEVISCQPDQELTPESSAADTHTDGSAVRKSVHAQVQTSETFGSAKICIEELSSKPEVLHHYTGLVNYDFFKFVLRTLGEGAYHLKYREKIPVPLSVENQFLMVLVRLRCHPPYFELAFLFGINERYISNIFITWINFMYLKWSKIDIWGTTALVYFHCPEDFKRLYPTTRVILDGVEWPIMKPSDPKIQQITYSVYKSKNTLKSVVGISPGGLVNYIPPVHGGSVSDRMFVERSDLWNICDNKNKVMVDKGFDIQDLFSGSDIKCVVPTFLRKGNQFSLVELERDRKIASKRVHVERVIGLAKTYKILQHPMNDIETVLGNRIMYVCFMLCNFRPRIVPPDA